MSFNFNILWIDDTPDWVDSIKKSIENFLKEKGFELHIIICEDGKDIEKKITPDIDLIAIDFHIPSAAEQGNDIIKIIRKQQQYIDILFYTQDTSSEDTLPLYDGVYRSSRETGRFESKMKELINMVLKRIESPTNMRGIIITETIDLESKIEDILIKIFGEKGELFKNRILHSKGQWLDFKKKDTLLNGIIKEALEKSRKSNEGIYNSLNSIKEILSKFNDEVIEQRNVLAHVKEEKIDGKVTLTSKINNKNTIVTIDQEWCKKIRHELKKHHKNLDDLIVFINANNILL